MEATLLWKFLHGLCDDFHWDYAVFWKFHPEEMLLKWEEGYCYHPTLRSLESEPAVMGFSTTDPIFSSTRGSSRYDGCLYGFPVGLSLDDMTSVRYHLGDGVVGKVAYTGNHSWILSEHLLVCDLKSNVVSECPDEWLLQFATGIKTIVLIPVAQHGVLQLGSSNKVGEDLTLVALVRDKLNIYLNNMDVVRTSIVDCETKTSTSHISTINLDGIPTSTISQMKPENPETVFTVNNKSTTNQMMPAYFVEDACYVAGENRVDNDNSMRGNDISCQFFGLDGMLPFDLDIAAREMLDFTMLGSSIVEEEMKYLSYSDYNFDIIGEDKNLKAEFVEPFVCENTDSLTNVNSLFSFSMDYELHKALGSTSQRQSNVRLWNPAVASEASQSSLSVLLNRNLSQCNESSSWQPSQSILNRDDDDEHLLEAVYVTIDSYLNDDMSKKNNDDKSSIESSDRFSASTNECAFVNKIGVPRISVTVNGPKNVATRSPPPPPFLTESSLSTSINEQRLKKGYKYPQTKKGSKVCKKRAGLGETPKPRPRDRQLIQERVKELRELVPNGSKCSIDGLLDSTIKHMLFLRGISERAGKLRHWVNQEVTGYKKKRLSSPEPDGKNGTSWAFEIGSDFQVCPIVVKDLEHPGHMLIEMLCSDNGLFLEIAEVIRRLNLTIMKGVMEGRANNTWAHFIVEVSKGFQRLDIFWPLMQVLQKNRIPVSG